MSRIIVDAGHGGNDAGDIYENRYEKTDNLNLALAIGEILQSKYNYEVIYTRTSDTYLSQMDRVQIANSEGGDLLLSIHRIIGDIPVSPPGLGFYIDEEGGLSETVANHIGKELEELGFSDYLTDIRTDLPLFRDSDMPAIMAGIGYMNSQIDNELFDARLEDIAEAIAKGVVDSFALSETESVSLLQSRKNNSRGVRKPKEKSFPSTTYRIRVGIHSGYQNALEQQKVLIIKGYPAQITRLKEGFAVEVCSFQELDTAVYLVGLLQREGYDTIIVTEDFK